MGCEKIAIAFCKTSRSMVTWAIAGVADEARHSHRAACHCPEGIVTLMLVLALPFAQQAFSDAERLGHMTKRRAGKHLIYDFTLERFGKTSSGLGREHSLQRTLSSSSQYPLSLRQAILYCRSISSAG